MASPKPQYAIYLCDNTQRHGAFYIIVRILGVVPKSLYLNLQGVPEEFENATCHSDLELVESGLNTKEDVIRFMHNTISNNSTGMQSSNVRFFKIRPNEQAYFLLLNSPPAIRAALNSLYTIHHPDSDLLTISNTRQMVGVRFLYTPAVSGGAACNICGARGTKTQTVAELKALCKKRGLHGYSRMTKAELIKILQRRS